MDARAYRIPKKTVTVQALLFRHVYLLIFILGIMGVQHPLFAITCFAFILLVDSRTWRLTVCLMLMISFSSGYIFYTLRHETINTTLPEWAHLRPDNRAPTVHIEGLITNVQSMPDQRLRITLDDIRPYTMPHTDPLPAKLIWTWDQASSRPLVGQRIAQHLPLRPIGGFANNGTFDSATYWHNKDVMLRSWSRGKAIHITHDTPRPDTIWRENWRSKIVHALGLNTYDKATDKVVNNTFSKMAYDDSSAKALSHDITSIKAQSSALIMALLFGDKFYLSHETVELFRESGLAHSLALSGQHLSVAALLALGIITLYGFFKPQSFERLPRVKGLILMSLPFALFYLWLGSAPPSLVRATCMLGISALLLVQNRHRQLIDVVCLALVIIVIIHPVSLFDLSLQLSFLALAGIALFLPVHHKLWQRMAVHDDYKNTLWQCLPQRIFWGTMILACISLAAQLGTLPLSVSVFGTQSSYSFLNLLWLPVLSFWVLPVAFIGLFCTMLGLDTLGQYFLNGATWPCQGILHLLAFCKATGMEAHYVLRPTWTMALGYVSIMVGISLRFGRLSFPNPAKRCLVAGCLLLCITPIYNIYHNYTAYINDTVSLRLLDTGQSQAVLIEWAYTPFATGVNRLLIDGGGFNSPRFNSGSGILAPILTQGRFPHVNSLILTHPDTDHMQGLIFLAEAFAVDSAYIPASTDSDLVKISEALMKNNIPTKYIQKPTSIKLAPNLRLDILPCHIMKGNDGIVVRLVHQTREENNKQNTYQDIGLALVMGDMGKRAQSHWLTEQKSSIKTQSVIVPHHGSARDVLPALYDRTTPTIALAACGLGNAFEFPSKHLRATLEEKNIPLLSTSTHGEITLTWQNGVLKDVATFK